MRIAFFVGCFPYLSETFILRQITGLLDLGHEVDIYSEERPEEDAVHPEVAQYGLLERTTYMDLPAEAGYWELPVWPITQRSWPPGSEKGISNFGRVVRALPKLTQCLTMSPRLTCEVLNRTRYGYQAESLSSLYRLARLCERGKSYDVLHAHFGPVGNSFRFARSLFGAPMVVTFHGYDFSRWPQEKGGEVYDELFQTADVVISHSQYALRKLEELGCPSEKLHKLPVSSVDHSVFPFKERTLAKGETIRILTVARLTEKKGIEYSIRAVTEITKKHPDIHYDIVGEGPSRGELEALIETLGMEQIIFLHGARDSDYVQQMMNEAHLFVLASVTATDGDQEGTPVCLIEGQASGLPVLSTQHSGIPEIVVDGETGFLVAERNVDALKERLLHLLDHPESWAALGRAGRKHIEEKYSLDHLNCQLIKLYERAIKSAASNGAGAR